MHGGSNDWSEYTYDDEGPGAEPCTTCGVYAPCECEEATVAIPVETMRALVSR